MAKLVWDEEGKRFFETGVDQCALYKYGMVNDEPGYENGVAWSGITAINETPEGGEANDIYADNIKYLTLMSAENLNVTIEAYFYPDEFAECDGTYKPAKGMYVTQQPRKKFGLAFRSRIGNDTDGDSYAYKLHLIYNILASPSDNQHSTVNDSPEAGNFSWEGSTTPVVVGSLGEQGSEVEYKPTSRIIIDSRDFTTEAEKAKLTALENYLFGTDNTEPKLPTPAQVYELVTTGTIS